MSVREKHMSMNKLLGFVVGIKKPENRARLQVPRARGSAINGLSGWLVGDCAPAKRPGRRIGGVETVVSLAERY